MATVVPSAPDDPDAPFDLDPIEPLRPLHPASWRERVDDLLASARHRPQRWLGAAGLLLVTVAAGWWLFRPPAAAPIESAMPRAVASSGADAGGDASDSAADGPAAGNVSSPSTAGAATTTSTVASEVVAQAAGGVARPGVYRLPGGARVDDLVAAAGGLAPDADVDRVNLAAAVRDGERIWVPRRGEGDPPVVVAGSGGAGGAGADPGTAAGPGSADGGSAPIDLNRATEAELEDLPGVGPATAAAIVAYRTEHGPFTSVDGLLEVRGIGEAKLEQIRPQATV
jgi:competence protein ComEA